MDIVYVNCTSTGGYRYRILLVDIATQYYWFYGLKSTTSKDITNAFSQFHVDVDALPRQFHADFDRKIIRGKCLQ